MKHLLLLIIFISTSAMADDNTKVLSKYQFEKTKEMIQEFLINKRLTIFSTIDHQAGATGVNINLQPNTVIIFGNPQVGSLMIQKDPTIGVDLPLKIQIFKEGSETFINFKNVSALKEQYQLKGVEAVTDKVEALYAGLVNLIK